jgi:putative DNA primase/helicase
MVIRQITQPAKRNSNTQNQIQQIALEYLAHGIAPIPLNLDGTKSPRIRWRQYRDRQPTPNEVIAWFSDPAGIGILTGRVSFGLEVLDFDQPEIFDPWRSMVPGIIDKLTIVQTPTGGFHVFYRCERINVNTKIASWEEPDSLTFRATGSRTGCHGKRVKATRIETRGDGGYVVAPGSPVEVHSTHSPYHQCYGPPLPKIRTITPDERRQLWQAAATFDCANRSSRKVTIIKQAIRRANFQMQAKDKPSGKSTPWDDFDRRASWPDILTPHGWQQVSLTEWRRPGKTHGISAIAGRNADGIPILTVFSSNAGPLSGNGSHASWGPFRCYAALNHGGDAKAAARAVALLGYGSQSEDPTRG